MQTVFIFTHLIMIGAVTALLYIAFDGEPEEAWHPAPVSLIRVPNLLDKYKAFRCGMKARALLLTGQISRLKIPNRLIRRSGHTI
jgi:hypothetical protein